MLADTYRLIMGVYLCKNKVYTHSFFAKLRKIISLHCFYKQKKLEHRISRINCHMAFHYINVTKVVTVMVCGYVMPPLKR